MLGTKPSGVEWIDKIPISWDIERMKNQFEYAKGLNITKADLIDTGLAVVSYGQIHAKNNSGTTLKDEFIRYISPSNEAITDKAKLCNGDIVFADTSEDYDGLGNAVYMDRDSDIYAGYHTIIAKPKEPKYAKFFAYLFQSEVWRSQLRMRASGIKVYSVTQRMLNDVTLIIPEETAIEPICAYLDDRCSKIDAIIAEAKASIEEYKELKQAVIYEAVTKGLDKNVEMKDSGIEWIGNIPIFWEIKKIKYVADFNPKVTIEYDVNQNVGYVPMDAVKIGYMEPLESAIYKLSTGLTQFQNNDIVMAKVTPCFENGEIAIADNLAQEVGFGSSELFVYRAHSINRKFLLYYLQHIGFKEMAASTMTGTGGLKRVSSYFARNAEITYPSVAEQQRIVNYLDKYCEGIDSLITEKQSLIEDLESYRKSLIYEVVTGKRKVVA